MQTVSELAAWPPGYEALAVKSIDGVAYVPDGSRAVILFTSTAGQKVCLVAPMTDLGRAVAQIHASVVPGELTTLRAVE